MKDGNDVSTGFIAVIHRAGEITSPTAPFLPQLTLEKDAGSLLFSLFFTLLGPFVPSTPGGNQTKEATCVPCSFHLSQPFVSTPKLTVLHNQFRDCLRML
jgi:hypothetical protein